MTTDEAPESGTRPAFVYDLPDSGAGVPGVLGVDLNLLAILDALLQERHVTKAAERFGITQPAMSRALRKLRLLFRDELLVRVGSTYYLTSFAEELIGPLRQSLSLMALTLDRRATFDPQTDQGNFSIATTDFIAFVLLRPLAAALHDCAPKVSLTVRGVSSSTMDDVISGDVDMAILPTRWETTLPREVLLIDRWVCAVDRRSTTESSLSLDEYRARPSLKHARVLGAALNYPPFSFEPEAFRSDMSVALESFILLPFFLPGTRLKSLIPERVGRALEKVIDIALFDPPFDTPPVSEAMFWHPRNENNPLHLWMRDKLRSMAKSI